MGLPVRIQTLKRFCSHFPRYDANPVFIQYLQSDPLFYFSAVVTVVVSIVLHELAHGWAAIWQGDDTPTIQGHMNPNPLVHMGGFSLVLLVLVGISYGRMPVNPSRFRSRYGDALVSGAGPAMNLVLAILGLTLLGLWQRLGAGSVDQTVANTQDFLWVFGTTNIVLCLFNLLPVPPLDGASILANMHEGYARLANDPTKQQAFMFVFFFALMIAGGKFYEIAGNVGRQYVAWIGSV